MATLTSHSGRTKTLTLIPVTHKVKLKPVRFEGPTHPTCYLLATRREISCSFALFTALSNLSEGRCFRT